MASPLAQSLTGKLSVNIQTKKGAIPDELDIRRFSPPDQTAIRVNHERLEQVGIQPRVERGKNHLYVQLAFDNELIVDVRRLPLVAAGIQVKRALSEMYLGCCITTVEAVADQCIREARHGGAEDHEILRLPQYRLLLKVQRWQHEQQQADQYAD